MGATAEGHWYDIFCRPGLLAGACQRAEPTAGYYLRQRHRLIRRHEESLHLNPDHTARWGLRVDLELPGDPDAIHIDGEEEMFLFPLVYLRKNESRAQFGVYEEGGAPVPIPIRRECDDISAAALAQAFSHLLSEVVGDLDFDAEETEELQEAFLRVASSNALEASMALQWIRDQLGIDRPASAATTPQVFRDLGQMMVSSGLDEVLEMLVEHVMLWVPLRGRAHERRSVSLTQEITLRPRSIFRWSFGAVTEKPRWALRHRRWAKLARGEGLDDPSVLTIAGKPYSRRDWRPSLTALGERVGRPLAWMPFEFDLPTTYAKRCNSYHLEVRCPQGQTPRDLKVKRHPTPHSPRPRQKKVSRLRLSSRNARFDVPRGGIEEVAQFRVFIGIGNGYFPLTWFLAGTLTTVMLWILAGSNPPTSGESAQTIAGILLIVPALLAGLAATGGDVPISQLIGGARGLLLATGLSAVVAASVMAGMHPFDLGNPSILSLCAMSATATTVPLATSWLLSSTFAWHQMRRLRNHARQKAALATGVIAAALAVVAFAVLPVDSWLRVFPAGFLLAEMIVLSALASNRAAMPIDENRRYLGFSFLLAGLACLGLACVELGCLVHEHALDSRTMCTAMATDLGSARLWAEIGCLATLTIAFVIGEFAAQVAKYGEPREDEVHLAPRDLQALISKDSVLELPLLFERERRAGLRQ